MADQNPAETPSLLPEIRTEDDKGACYGSRAYLAEIHRRPRPD